MDVDLALVVEELAHQEFGVNVSFTWISVQALEQVIKWRMTRIFIAHLQGWASLPDSVS